MAKASGFSFAMLLGVISANIRTTTVITAVEIEGPDASPSRWIKSKVAIEVDAILTILLPIKTVVSKRSKFSTVLSTRAARLLPSSAIILMRILFRDENAVSVAEKNAENKIRIVRIII